MIFVVIEVGEAIDGDGRGRARFGAGGNHGVVRWSCGLLKQRVVATVVGICVCRYGGYPGREGGHGVVNCRW